MESSRDNNFNKSTTTILKISDVQSSKTLKETRKDLPAYHSIIEPTMKLKNGEATLTIVQADHTNMGVQSRHAMLVVERCNQDGTIVGTIIHLTGDSVFTALKKGNLTAVVNTLFRGNFISVGDASIEIKSLDLKNEIKYRNKSPTVIISVNEFEIMMGQIYKEQVYPPHFYLFSSQSSAIGFRNSLRPEKFANNCIEWAIRMCSYAGKKFSTKNVGGLLNFVNTIDFVGDKPIHITPPLIAELCEFARAGNIEAMEAYCASFPGNEINSYVEANKISSGYIENALGKFTALHLACIYEKSEAARWLLTHGASPEVNTQLSSPDIDNWLSDNNEYPHIDSTFMNTFNKLGREKCNKAIVFLKEMIKEFKNNRDVHQKTDNNSSPSDDTSDGKQEAIKPPGYKKN